MKNGEVARIPQQNFYFPTIPQQLNEFSLAELWQLPSFSNLRNYEHFLRNYDCHPIK
jgi:hypothetical protein